MLIVHVFLSHLTPCDLAGHAGLFPYAGQGELARCQMINCEGFVVVVVTHSSFSLFT